MGKPFKQIFLETTMLIDLTMYINNDLIIIKNVCNQMSDTGSCRPLVVSGIF
jgi:hypothetical protein